MTLTWRTSLYNTKLDVCCLVSRSPTSWSWPRRPPCPSPRTSGCSSSSPSPGPAPQSAAAPRRPGPVGGEQCHVTSSAPITAHLELPDVGVEAVLGHEGGRAGAGLGPRQLYVAVLHQVPLPQEALVIQQ